MTTAISKTMTCAAVLALAMAFAPAALAGCGDDWTTLKKHASWTSDSEDNPLLIEANFVNRQPIVGMWSVTFTAGGGTFDWGYQVWHDDGTEFMNSGSRAPATQNFCLGVWAQTGAFRYHLNHFAISYDPTGKLNAKANIKEDVAVDPRGNTFSGPFTVDVYSPSGNLLQHVAGSIVGQRISAN